MGLVSARKLEKENMSLTITLACEILLYVALISAKKFKKKKKKRKMPFTPFCRHICYCYLHVVISKLDKKKKKFSHILSFHITHL